ncbi:MAG: nucleotidyltransferase domain-containing protein [Candidatus Odinarchaeota archaeon]|nr:nucleotidyltransferase domain-containing protein [Candidatus Odinarchaeota archaeon]
MVRPHRDLKSILEDTLERIRPSQEEIDSLENVSKKLRKMVESFGKGKFKIKYVEEGGSLAKGTLLAGNGDIDIFVSMDVKSKDELVKFVEGFYREVLKNGSYDAILAYSENPYIRLLITEDGRKVEADIVPIAYARDENELRSVLSISGMARSPFHTRYVRKKLNDELKDEVRLLKYFSKVKRVYGTFGLTGWVCELLIIHFGSFIEFLKNVESFPHLRIDIEGRLTREEIIKKFPNDLVVIVDPVDVDRNASAGIQGFMGEIKVKRLLREGKRALKFPEKMFEKVKPEGNIVVTFHKREGILVPEENYLISLGHIVSKINKIIRPYKFWVVDAFLENQPPKIYLKVHPFKRESIELKGPPVSMKSAVERFLKAHEGEKVIIKDGRYFSISTPKFKFARDAVEYSIRTIPLKLFKGFVLEERADGKGPI